MDERLLRQEDLGYDAMDYEKDSFMPGQSRRKIGVKGS
jgi:hypothetical protein